MVDLRILQPGGELLGLVDELLVDPHSGRIAYVIARCRNGQRQTIPWRFLYCAGSKFRLRRPLSAPIADLQTVRRSVGEE